MQAAVRPADKTAGRRDRRGDGPGGGAAAGVTLRAALNNSAAVWERPDAAAPPPGHGVNITRQPGEYCKVGDTMVGLPIFWFKHIPPRHSATPPLVIYCLETLHMTFQTSTLLPRPNIWPYDLPACYLAE